MSAISSTELAAAVAAGERTNIESLRAPGERRAFASCVAANIVVLALCCAVVILGTSWLGTHPFIANHRDAIIAVLLSALVAGPATLVGRRAGIPFARANGLRVDREQYPELYAMFVDGCAKLGIEPMPALYLSDGIDDLAVVHTARRNDQAVIVLSATLFDKDWLEWRDAVAFVLARALGALRLGHARWSVELLTVYTRIIPHIRTPLLVKWAESRDRCAAFVVPDGIRGLLLECLGKDVLVHTNMPAFLRSLAASAPPEPFWSFVNVLRHRRPPMRARIDALYRAGLFDRGRDLERWNVRADANASASRI